jgi:hypothetical protein
MEQLEQQIIDRINAQDEKLEEIWRSVEKTRKYFLWTFWTTVIMFVLPLIGLIIVIPMFINTYMDALGGSGALEGLL